MRGRKHFIMGVMATIAIFIMAGGVNDPFELNDPNLNRTGVQAKAGFLILADTSTTACLQRSSGSSFPCALFGDKNTVRVSTKGGDSTFCWSAQEAPTLGDQTTVNATNMTDPGGTVGGCMGISLFDGDGHDMTMHVDNIETSSVGGNATGMCTGTAISFRQENCNPLCKSNEDCSAYSAGACARNFTIQQRRKQGCVAIYVRTDTANAEIRFALEQ